MRDLTRRLVLLSVALTQLTVLANATPTSTSLYGERYRPQFHFSPAWNWMNDPNGLVYLDGEYHLFFQYNPFGDKWGHMSWGHAVSTASGSSRVGADLLRWRELPVAIPELTATKTMIFSGSAIVDHENASGLAPEGSTAPLMLAFYTAHGEHEQTQALAYSNDRGRTFTQFPGNPVIDLNKRDFRDPKVFWHAPSRQFIMAVALPTEHKILFYRSSNLTDWEEASSFGPAGDTTGIWECPDLFPLTVDGREKWVLMLSVGKTMQYFVGDFNGTTFRNENPAGLVLRVDHGPDYFAAVTFNHAPAPAGRVSIGWMSNWNYAAELPTSPWRGQMSVPRVLSLASTSDGTRLVQRPFPSLHELRGEHVSLKDRAVTSTLNFGDGGHPAELMVTVDPRQSSRFGLRVGKGKDHETVIGYDSERKELYLDRTRSGNTSFYAAFPGRYTAPCALQKDGTLKLHVLVDACSVEVFADDGLTALTGLFFPEPDDQGIEFFTEGSPITVISADAWRLGSIWK